MRMISIFNYVIIMVLLLASCTREDIKIACVGDSITEGAGLAYQNKTAYPTRLDSILGPGFAVMNFGRSGTTLLKKADFPYWTCKEFYDVFEYQPDIIIIKLGSNDSKPFNWNADNFARDYQALIDTFNTIASRPSIFLCLPVPVYKTAWGINDSTVTEGVIPIIKKVAGKNHLPVIDLYHSMKNQPENFPDGVHPNENGALAMADIVARELKLK
jgi:acyl-CoA thioesterase I